MAGAGWAGSLVPEAQNGAGLAPDGTCALLEAAGGRLAPEPLAACIAAGLALACAKTPYAVSLLRGLIRGERIVVPAAPADGAWPGEPGIGAASSASGIRLSGSVERVPDVIGASDFLIGLEVEKDFVLLHLEISDPALELQMTPTVDGGSLGAFHLDGLMAKPEHILLSGAPARLAYAALADTAALGRAAQLVGVMGEALRITVQYLKTREQFGRPIGSFQALQHRAASAHIDIGASRSLLYEACRAFGTLKQRRAAAAAVAHACAAALRVTQDCVQLHGAIGYADECDIGLFLRRAMALAGAAGGEIANRRRYAEAVSG
jgi:alkylation response protein AidB-like acyl-CoA dehydrogenase